MSRKCCAPVCPLDDSGGYIRLFSLPVDLKVLCEWQERLGLGVEAARDEIDSGEEILLCEIHFDEFCWEGSSDQKTLKRTAVPSIFQHSTPLVYLERLYAKLKSANICPDFGEQGIHFIKELSSAGVLEDHNVQEEIVRFSNLLGISALQKVRLHQKTEAIVSIEAENCILAQEVDILKQNLKHMVGEQCSSHH